ncbi:MAG TPA: tRNA (adenosine(37)-N6)-dimethylallyltransferase MiaA [Ilumatobacteraceae bacterium]|nr:tRNA (adenosine(37)-N6)-dimethylallyltransferase MiaA [Ilumatobacteraceae bacterium]
MNQQPADHPRPIVIVGPTASGKSDVAMAWCQRTASSEIVAVDSMQVYRGMDIGTAKPTPDDRRRVVHHCLDLAEPDETFTVAAFTRAATTAIDAIAARRHQAVLVAGTGLYLRAITDPMEMPGQWPHLRAEMEQRCRERGPQAVYAELAVLDPIAASRIDACNVRRIVRAMEVIRGSGQLFSSFGDGINIYPPTPYQQFGIRWPRPQLRARIATRVERMIEAGLVDEVTTLVATSQLSITARQALGYKEIIEHLEGRVSLDEAIAQITLRTQQFAVRQARWFGRDPRIRWIDIDGAADHNPVDHVIAVLEEEAAA